jgi:hypothetical protein
VHLENVVLDAVDPRTTGRAWEAELGTEELTDDEGGYETRLAVPGGPELDLCFPRVPEEPTDRPRLTLDVHDGELRAVRLESADPARDLVLWRWLTGWEPVGDERDAAGEAVVGLRHPSGRGPLLALVAEVEPKPATKNRAHLDVRLGPDDDPDAVAAGIAERGGRELHLGFGHLPWRHFADPSGNELCVLPAPAG